jgi:homoserine kinase
MKPVKNISKAFAPATVANVGPGFDVLSFSLEGVGDTISLQVCEEGITIEEVTGFSKGISLDIKKNVIGPVIEKMIEKSGYQKGLRIRLEKGIPLGSGIGSSSASSAVAAIAFNDLLGNPFSKQELVEFAKYGEELACGNAHLDNVAPAIFGGVCLVLMNDQEIYQVPMNSPFYCCAVRPELTVMTREARTALPKNLSLEKASSQWGRLAGFVLALSQGDAKFVAKCFEDSVAEPARKHLIENFSNVKEAALLAGALGCSISGSGPSVFTICTSLQIAQKVQQAIQEAWKQEKIDSFGIVCQIPCSGGRVVSNEKEILQYS